MIKYVADWRYGKPELAKVTIAKETPKTFTITEDEAILGWFYFGKRVNKNKYNWFDTRDEAISFLIKRGKETIDYRHKLIDRLEQEVKSLKEMLNNA